VITLAEQKCINDQPWMDILQRTRTGDCTKEDLKEIRKLIITNPKCNIPAFDKEPWKDGLLVTPRNSMKALWNSAALTKHCQETGQILYICDAEDTVGEEHRRPNMEERTTIAKIPLEDLDGLPHRIELAIGMKAMVTANVATEADLANGS
jgi:hypothetical protein